MSRQAAGGFNSRLNLSQAAFEKSPLAVIGDKLQRALIILGGLRQCPEAPKQISPRSVQQMVAVEVAPRPKGIDEVETGARAISHRDCNGAVQRHNGRRLQALERTIQSYYLAPISIFSPSSATMLGSDRGLDSEWTGLTAKRFADQRKGFGDLLPIPAAAVLLLKKYKIAGLVQPGIAP